MQIGSQGDRAADFRLPFVFEPGNPAGPM